MIKQEEEELHWCVDVCFAAPLQKNTLFLTALLSKDRSWKINNERKWLPYEARKEVLKLKKGLKPQGPPKQHGATEPLSSEAQSA